mgnify:FL=1
MPRIKLRHFLLSVSNFSEFCQKMPKKWHLLTFNTDNVEICANVKNIAHY